MCRAGFQLVPRATAQPEETRRPQPGACKSVRGSAPVWSQDGFAYDAVFAVAHALHELIEQRRRADIAGEELTEALLGIRFDGITGHVQFNKGSLTDGKGRGDRRGGVDYDLKNYVGSSSSNLDGLVNVARLRDITEILHAGGVFDEVSKGPGS